MKPKLILFFFAVGTIFFSCKPFQKLTPVSYTETWVGEALQYNTNEKWQIVLSYSPKTNLYKINYPDLECSGIWQEVARDNKKIDLKEFITQDTYNQCIKFALVQLNYKDENNLYVKYYDLEGNMIADGLIQKNNEN